ncbi:MAG TPA: MBL fold metallo-hydrolase [Dehalococcoidia bacterium]|nr:MBL fold metallo-hydrolase [Dehalococcoidia bacterium]
MSTGQPPPAEEIPPPYLEEVSPSIFAYVQLDGTWCLNNPAFIVGPSSVTAVDACATERRSRDSRAAIARTTPNIVNTLVNTHSHMDHTFGNFVFSPGATIVGHERCRADIETERFTSLDQARGFFPDVDWGEIKITAPSLTFDDRITLFVGDLEVQLIYVSPAHTMTGVVAWIPERRVLIAGDVIFSGGAPFALQGSIAGWLGALDRLRDLGPESIIPGHGPVCGPELFSEMEAYLRFVQDTARVGFETGVRPLELALDTDLGEFARLTDPERIVGNLFRAYSELEGKVPGAPIDAIATRDGMIAFNGGHPLRCLA